MSTVARETRSDALDPASEPTTGPDREPAPRGPAPGWPAPGWQAPGRPAGRERIDGIDLARSLAMLGMIAVHISVADYVTGDSSGAPGWLGYLLGLAGGRASVLFFLLAGVSAIILARSLPRDRWTRAFLVRGALLVVGGTLFTHYWWPASILQNYGVVFLITPLLLHLRSRTLLGLAAVSLAIGPLLVQLGWPTELSDGLPLGHWIYTGLVEPLNAGTYPLTVWICFFVVGLVLGRLDLRDRALAQRLAVGSMAGLLLITPVFKALDTARSDTTAGSQEGFWYDDYGLWYEDYGDDSPTGIDLWQLTEHDAHADTPTWMIEALLMAGLVLGGCLLLLHSDRARRPVRPLVALGTVSLTAYVTHGFVIGIVAERWYPDTLLASWTRALTFLLTLQAGLVTLAWLHRQHYRRGPLEWAVTHLSRPSGRGHG
jgi:uncharacterized membrane protein YeiB